MTLHQAAYRVVLWAFVVFVTSFLALGVWDLVLIARGDLSGNSASGVVLQVAQAHPFWVFLIGLALGTLIGHFLWYQTVVKVVSQ